MYDADGNRVKGTVDGVVVVYIAGLYEWQAGATTKYYDGGAMRRSGQTSDNGVFYMLADHLGSTSVIVSQAGVEAARNYHFPFGANRGSAFSSLTTKRFTGQYHEAGLAGMEGLSYYNARWYDPQVGRFASADTIVPTTANPQALNRYTYVNNQPTNAGDRTGHACDDGPQTWAACFGSKPVSRQVWHAADTSYGRGSARLSTVLRWRQLLTLPKPNRPRYIQTKHYGVIDIDHFEGARDQATRILRPLENGEKNFPVSQPLAGEIFGFAARYAPIRTTNAAALHSVALGIFYDFSIRFETWQGSGLLGEIDKGRGYSSFAAEDFPSDHLGFMSVEQGLPLEYIIGVLGGGEPIDQKPPIAARNYSFTPLVPDNQGVYHNVPWPAELQMTPEHAFRFIDSWQFLFERP